MKDTVPNSIAAVHAEDVTRVRRRLQAAIEEAGAAWMPADAILDALALELAAFAERHSQPDYVAAFLRRLAHHYGTVPHDVRH